jgi:UDP-N-acetylglucosamine:LPS N-acetylglucosamine transferase
MPLNTFFHIHYDGVIVPDIDPGGSQPNLSGKLCKTSLDATNRRAYFAGILASTKKMALENDLDFLIIVSGPEPQRTKLEEIITRQVQKLPGEKVVLLGSPQKDSKKKLDENTTLFSYVSNEEKVLLMNRARFIISRSGYTTMMEMVELDKKRGLFTPTPGQTEQEYLSRYYQQQGWFLSRSQYSMDLESDTKEAMKFGGFPKMPKTGDNVRKLYQDVLKKHLT